MARKLQRLETFRAAAAGGRPPAARGAHASPASRPRAAPLPTSSPAVPLPHQRIARTDGRFCSISDWSAFTASRDPKVEPGCTSTSVSARGRKAPRSQPDQPRQRELVNGLQSPAALPPSWISLLSLLIASGHKGLKTCALTYQTQQGTFTFWQKLQGGCVVTYICCDYRKVIACIICICKLFHRFHSSVCC